MSLRSSPGIKWQGSAGSYAEYAEEGQIESASAALAYHDRPKDGVVFPHVRGKATAHLPGLNLELGLLLDQHKQLHNGAWDGIQYLRKGTVLQWETDDKGKFVERPSEDGMSLERIPIMDEKTGKQAFKRTHTAGYDISFSVSKDVDEYLIRYPQYIPLVQELLQKSVDTAMTVGVEEYAKVVRVPVAKSDQVWQNPDSKMQGGATERVTADGLVWWSTFGSSARPTAESLRRGYTSDPHLHLHCFLSSMAIKDGKWRKLDGSALMKTTEIRQDIASNEFARLLEENGFALKWGETDRKGRRSWEIEGSKPENRQYLSTNSDRKREIIDAFEAKNGKPMSPRQLDVAMQATKGAKSEAAKLADMGKLDQYELWHQSMKNAGLSIDMPERGQPRKYDAVMKRIEAIYTELESESGLNRYCDIAAYFSSDIVFPAAIRASAGLGFTPTEVRELAQNYIDHRLVPVRKAKDESARYYTTETIRSNERLILDGVDRLATGMSPSVKALDVAAVLDRQKVTPDAEQIEVIKAVTGKRQLVNIAGPAGTGKGFALEIAAEVLRESSKYVPGQPKPERREIVVAAVGAKRAAELSRQIGADRGGSIESLYRQWKAGWRPSAFSVIVLDESAMANSFQMAKLMEVVGKAKLVMVGDEHQAAAINVAGWASAVNQKHKPIELRTIYRQKDENDQVMLNALRAGRSEVAVSMLDRKNRIHIADDPQELVALVASRYALHRESGRSVTEVALVHQGFNSELDSYNRAVQRWRAEHNEIDRTESFVVSQEDGREWTLNKGDRIIFNKAMWVGMGTPVRNGDTGTLLAIDASGRCKIKLDHKDRNVSLKLARQMPEITIGLAYCQSTNKYQGGEAKVVLATPGTPGIASQNSGYSQLSRMIEHVEVLLDSERWGGNARKALAEAWAVGVHKIMATTAIEADAERLAEPAVERAELERIAETVQARHGMSL